jgi:hypothetical protein
MARSLRFCAAEESERLLSGLQIKYVSECDIESTEKMREFIQVSCGQPTIDPTSYNKKIGGIRHDTMEEIVNRNIDNRNRI